MILNKTYSTRTFFSIYTKLFFFINNFFNPFNLVSELPG